MATRKDGKGRALRKGEHYRKRDGRYSYSYNDVFGNRKFIYSNNLAKLRERVDPRRYNGAVFLGVNGSVVKSHGGTDAFGFSNAQADAKTRQCQGQQN